MRLLAFGWYGAGNVGDELLLDALKRWAGERDVSVVAISIDPVYTARVHGIEAIDFHDLPGVARAMSRTDLFVLGGGGLFQTHDEFSIAGFYDFASPDVALYARLLAMAQQMGVRTLAWAQGVGPLHAGDPEEIVFDLFNSVDSFSVRDEGSRALLADLGISREIAVAPDPVWAHPVSTTSSAPSGVRRIGIVVRPWPFVDGWEQRFIDAIRAAVPTEGTTLVWLPFQPHAVPGRSASDEGFVRELIGRVGGDYQHELARYQSLEEAVDVLRGCRGVIAMRLHAQILALRLGKPTLCIEYDPKMNEASAQVGLSADMRIDVAAAPSVWQRTLRAWCSTLAAQGDTQASAHVDRLAFEALEHRRVLHEAIDAAKAAPRRSRWTSQGFDWLGTWQALRYQQVLDDRDRQIARAMGDATTLARTVTERDRCVAELTQRAMALAQAIGEREMQAAELNRELTNVREQLDTRQDTIRQKEADIARLTQALSEHANEVFRLSRILDDRKVQLEAAEEMLLRKQTEIDELRMSTSWRITRPLRSIRRLLRNPRQEWSEFVSLLYSGERRSARQEDPAPNQSQESSRESQDLTWQEFEERVLSRRSEFKGVYVQNTVIDWNVPLFQRPQHMAAAMARLGYLVIYRTDNWAGDDVEGCREVEPNVWLTNRPEVDSLTNTVRSIYSTAYATDPSQLAALQECNALAYEYIDHIDPQISGEPENIRRLLALKEWAFGGGADVVIASAKVLEAEAISAVGRSKVILVPNGVDTRHYRSEIHDETVLPERLVAFRARYDNIVGYFGAIAPWLWYDALSELVAARPDLGFVFIGPDYYGGAERLPRADNVLYLGTVDYKILPAYARQFDVCFIPFEPGEIARTTSPLKLFEYFALEKPVVVTSDMLECVAHPEVLAGDSSQALSNAIDAAIDRKNDPVFRKRLAALADENDWSMRAKVVSDFCTALSGERSDRDDRPSPQTQVA